MLRPQPVGPVPAETTRVARAAFPDGHPYFSAADALGALFTDTLFEETYPPLGQPALSPWRLALVTILQFAEGLSDRRAADAVRARLDWKYVLRLELTDPGFDASVLCEFRGRLQDGGADRLLLDTLLAWCQEHGLLAAGGRQRTDSTHVLARVRGLHRVELVLETLRHALDVLAVAAPTWQRDRVGPGWAERYVRRPEDDRLPTGAARQALAVAVGNDGYALLTAATSGDAPPWLRSVPAVETLRRVWVQNFFWTATGAAWRPDDAIPPAAQFLSSSHDGDARYSHKRSTTWVGYKVHLTETCDAAAPRLITHVATAPATTPDGEAIPEIHRTLEGRGRLPGTHVVDTGYVDAGLLVASAGRYGVDLLGPARGDHRWQTRAGDGFGAEHFRIDWDAHRVTCPSGRMSQGWTATTDNQGRAVVRFRFSSLDCRPCPLRDRCIRTTAKYAHRSITVRPQPQYEALRAARLRARTPECAAAFAWRAGIEGTLSRGVRTCRLRRTRYTGLPRAHLGHVLIAVALNFLRLGEWLAGVPLPATRRSPFAAFVAGLPQT